jgi:hypothetical protein
VSQRFQFQRARRVAQNGMPFEMPSVGPVERASVVEPSQTGNSLGDVIRVILAHD